MGEINLLRNNVTKTIMAKLGTIICIMVCLGNILYKFIAKMDFSVASIVNFSAEAGVYLASVWIIYIISCDIGNKDGKQTDEYKASMEAYSSIRNKMFCKVKELSEWIAGYVIEELYRKREEILLPNDVTMNEFAKVKGMSRRKLRGAGYERWQIRAIRTARKAKPDKLTAKKLLTGHDVKLDNGHAIHPSKAAAIDAACNLTRYTIGALLIVNIGFTASVNTDLQAVIMSTLFSTLGLAATLLTGYGSGYRCQAVVAVNYTAEQVHVLEKAENDISKKGNKQAV